MSEERIYKEIIFKSSKSKEGGRTSFSISISPSLLRTRSLSISLFPQRLAPSGLYKSVNPFNVDKTPAPNQAGFNQTASSILELSVGERQSHRPAMMVL